MKKIYEVVKYNPKAYDEFPQLMTFDKAEAASRAAKEKYYCDKDHVVEVREFEVPDTFDIDLYVHGDEEMNDMICDSYNKGYDIIRG